MRRAVSLACLLFAWPCAHGALLDAVQVFAWGKMFSENARTMSVSRALPATFDPATPCEVCLGVAAVKDTAAQQLPTAVESTGAEKSSSRCTPPRAPYSFPPPPTGP